MNNNYLVEAFAKNKHVLGILVFRILHPRLAEQLSL
jgi:hypothetical protein